MGLNLCLRAIHLSQFNLLTTKAMQFLNNLIGIYVTIVNTFLFTTESMWLWGQKHKKNTEILLILPYCWAFLGNFGICNIFFFRFFLSYPLWWEEWDIDFALADNTLVHISLFDECNNWDRMLQESIFIIQ